MQELEYPFDSSYILTKKKQIKRELLGKDNNYLEKKIAILGGSTTNDIKLILELFLLNYGIKPIFYESEYNKYYEDAVFENKELEEFKPDIIYIHTTSRNIQNYPKIIDTKEYIESLLNNEYNKFLNIWTSIRDKYNCPIIQNNFELPFYRLLGNKSASNISGNVNYITKLNMKFYDYAESKDNFYINDINYISASFGLDKWHNTLYYYMYKYALDVNAIPTLAFNIANIIKSIYGKNKKGFVLDLDNTLWGGIVGDDGVDNLVLGPEMPRGQVFSEFQEYIKAHKDLGIILNINSKNEEENALAGIAHPDSVLNKDDFIVIKANWNSKDKNFIDIANILNLGVDSLVFIDDNPAEREIIKKQIPNVAVPDINTPEEYIKIIDRSGFFEVTGISRDDFKRNEMYRENAARNVLQATFENYEDYLISLKMKSEINNFIPIYYSRIGQLSNKSNQFNLTTKRYTQNEIEEIAGDDNYIELYGTLKDIFGDNGLISVVIGKIKEKILNIELWIMSCRVLKRDMEYAMLDELVEKAKDRGITNLRGYYYPTDKNKMVKDFYDILGFKKINEDGDGNTVWNMDIKKDYINKNKVIQVIKEESN